MAELLEVFEGLWSESEPPLSGGAWLGVWATRLRRLVQGANLQHLGTHTHTSSHRLRHMQVKGGSYPHRLAYIYGTQCHSLFPD